MDWKFWIYLVVSGAVVVSFLSGDDELVVNGLTVLVVNGVSVESGITGKFAVLLSVDASGNLEMIRNFIVTQCIFISKIMQ